MTTAFEIVLACLWAAATAGVAWCCVVAARSITYVTLADGQRTERRMPVIMRLLLPFTRNLTPFFERPAFLSSREKINRKLIACGFEDVMSPSDFLALRVLVPAVLIPILIVLLWFSITSIPGRIGLFLFHKRFLLYAVFMLLAFVYPASWLQKELTSRHRSIQRSLPFILDLLTLSVEAGMDFMSALQRIVDKRQLDALCEEFIRVLREIQLGKTRKQALQAMAHRVNFPDLYSVTNALIQADEMGASIGRTLRIQADQMRMRRFQRAEKMAHEAPVKMLFPLIAFIFPAVFFILLGPVFYQMAQSWF